MLMKIIQIYHTMNHFLKKIKKNTRSWIKNIPALSSMRVEHALLKSALVLLIINAALLLFLVMYIGIVKISPTPLQEHGQYSALNQENLFPFFETLPLFAEGVIVHDDATDETWYALNDRRIFGIASLTKIMTSIIALEDGDPDQRIVITQEALMQPGDHGLLRGDVWALDQLIEFMMITSSNDAAFAIASQLYPQLSPDESRRNFIMRMNQKAYELALPSLLFLNESGLDKKGIVQNFGTAQDVLMLMKYAHTTHSEIFYSTTLQRYEYFSEGLFSHQAENTNRIIGSLPSLVFSKTGYTGGGGGSLGIIFERSPGDRVFVIALGSGFQERFSDVQMLTDRVFHSMYYFEKE